MIIMLIGIVTYLVSFDFLLSLPFFGMGAMFAIVSIAQDMRPSRPLSLPPPTSAVKHVKLLATLIVVSGLTAVLGFVSAQLALFIIGVCFLGTFVGYWIGQIRVKLLREGRANY
jgi:hypothetical protein